MTKKSAKKIVVDDIVTCGKLVGKDSAEVWVLADSKLRAKAKNLSQAEELLVDKIWSVCDLDEPFAIKYIEADLGVSALAEELLWVGANSTIDSENPEQYFPEGICATCGGGKGARNAKALELENVPKKIKAGFMVRFYPRAQRVRLDIFHSSICEVLASKHNPLIEFRPVIDKKRGATDFCEIISVRQFLEVIPSGKKNPGGQCAECGRIFLYNGVNEQYLKKDDAHIIRQHGAAATGDFSTLKLCVSNIVWQKLKKVEASRGLLKLSPFTELDDENINHNPKLENPFER